MFVKGSNKYILINKALLNNNNMFEMTTEQKQNIVNRLFVSQ